MSDLPSPGDPLIIGTNQVYDPVNPIDAEETHLSVSEYATRNNIINFKHFAPIKVLLKDNLPEPEFKEQTAVTTVVAMRLLGLDLVDIADVLNTDLRTINNILEKESVQKTFELMLKNIISHNANIVQGRISSYANSAVSVVNDLMTDEEVQPIVRLKAAQDFLDRSGLEADQFFKDPNKDNQSDNQLEIIITRDGTEKADDDIKISVKK